MTPAVAATRLAAHIQPAEATVDDAMIAVAHLMATMIEARRQTGAASHTGQHAVMRLAKAQVTLVGVSSDVLRVHRDLIDIHREVAGGDVHEKCEDGAGIFTSAQGGLAAVG